MSDRIFKFQVTQFSTNIDVRFHWKIPGNKCIFNLTDCSLAIIRYLDIKNCQPKDKKLQPNSNQLFMRLKELKFATLDNLAFTNTQLRCNILFRLCLTLSPTAYQILWLQRGGATEILRFENLEITRFCHTLAYKIAIILSILEIQGSSFGFRPLFISSKNDV